MNKAESLKLDVKLSSLRDKDQKQFVTVGRKSLDQTYKVMRAKNFDYNIVAEPLFVESCRTIFNSSSEIPTVNLKTGSFSN